MSEEILDLIDELHEKGRESQVSFFIVSITESGTSWSASVSDANRKIAGEIMSRLIGVLEKMQKLEGK